MTFHDHARITGTASEPATELSFTGSNDGTIRAINPDGTEKWSVSKGGNIADVTLLPSEDYLYAVDSENANYWKINASDGSEVWARSSSTTSTLTSIVPNDDGTLYFVVGANGDIKREQDSDGTVDWTNSDHGTRVEDLSMGPNGNNLHSGGWDNVVRQISVSDGSTQWSFSGHTDFVQAVSVIPDGSKLYSTARDSKVFAIDTSDGSQLWEDQTTFADTTWSASTSYDGSEAYVGTRGGVIKSLSGADGSEVWSATPHTDDVNDIAPNAAGNAVHTASTDQTSKAIDPSDGSVIWTFTGHTSTVTSVTSAGIAIV